MTCYDLAGGCYICACYVEQGGGRQAWNREIERDELTRLLVRGGKDVKVIY